MRSLFALFALFALAYAGDCVGSYGSWGVCDGACGSQSTQNRFYSIQIPATAGGAPCPIAAGAFESRPCTVKCSTENCVGSWQTPSPCVSKGICGSDAGSQTRSYKVTRPTGPGGEDCPIADGTQETLACSAPITPCQGCEGYWTAWGACESEGRCGSDLGHQSRTYKITQQKAPGGADCPATDGQVATQRCSAAVTPCRGCSGHFEEPTACVSKGICDSAAGTHTKKYIVDVVAEAGGALCPYQNNQVVIEACSAPITPCVHCEGSWSVWSDCVSNGKCGSSAGKKKRTYTITQEAQNGGRSCEATNGQVQFGNCAAPITPCRGCSGSWSDFTECVSDGQCGSDAGTHKRTFTVTDPGEVGGAKCEATNGFVQTSPCAAPVTPCPAENCEGSFNGFSTCRAVSCGTTAGKQSRTFTVTKVAKYGGADCAHSNQFVETVDCEAPFTPCPVNCEGEFLAPVCVSNGVCDSPAGTQTEKYVISVKGANGGTNCPYADGYERKSACVAPITPCPPEDGEGQWSAWSECKAKSCGTTEGTYYATYHQTKAPKYGGKPCEAAEGQVRTAECVAVNTPCPVDCIGKFTEWTPCESKGICSNAAGTQKRTYEISQQAAHGGNACAHTHGQTEQQDCAATITPCPPEPCIGSWSEPTKCVQSKCDDNTGTNKQTFTVSKKARYGGTECEAENGDVRTNQCTVAAPIERCPIDCKGSYGEFTRCTPVHACGSTKGRRSRIYTIDVPAQFGGVRCPRTDNSEEEEECKVDLVACPPINCVGHWTEPSACTQVDCDESDGVNSQQFIVTRAAAHGGVECSSKHGDVKQNNCTVDAEHLVRCPIACVGRWSAPTECEAIEECGCNKGTQQKTFEVVTKAEFGGAECPFVHEQKVTQKCLVPAHKVERCPNEILDAPCEDLRGLLTEAKATRCQLEAIVAALEAKK